LCGLGLNSVAGFVLRQTSALGSTWTAVTNSAAVVLNGSNQVTIPAQTGTELHRLAALQNTVA
jgi:hypothetical protein